MNSRHYLVKSGEYWLKRGGVENEGQKKPTRRLAKIVLRYYQKEIRYSQKEIRCSQKEIRCSQKEIRV